MNPENRIFYLNFYFSTNFAVPWTVLLGGLHITRPLQQPKPPIQSTLLVCEDEGTAALKMSVFTS